MKIVHKEVLHIICVDSYELEIMRKWIDLAKDKLEGQDKEFSLIVQSDIDRLISIKEDDYLSEYPTLFKEKELKLLLSCVEIIFRDNLVDKSTDFDFIFESSNMKSAITYAIKKE